MKHRFMFMFEHLNPIHGQITMFIVFQGGLDATVRRPDFPANATAHQHAKRDDSAKAIARQTQRDQRTTLKEDASPALCD